MDATQVGLLITGITPFVVPIIVGFVKKLPLPTWILPILATFLGMAMDVGNHFATGGGLGLIGGAVLGAAGVGIREIADQLKQVAAGP